VNDKREMKNINKIMATMAKISKKNGMAWKMKLRVIMKSNENMAKYGE